MGSNTNRLAVGDATAARLFLQRSGIIVPPTNPAVVNLAEHIWQPEVRRNKVPEAQRIAELRAAQETWINQPVTENGTGKKGTVRFLTVRRDSSNCFDRRTRDRNVYVAIVDWDKGGCHRGLSTSQLSLSKKKKTSTKAST